MNNSVIKITPLARVRDAEEFRVCWMGQTRIAKAKNLGLTIPGYSFKAEKLYAIVRALENIKQSEHIID